MPLKIKIMLLAILPMVAVTTLTTWIGSQGARLLSEQEIEVFEASLLESKRRELRHYVEMAETSIRPVVEAEGVDPVQAQARVKQILHDMTFGEDGYFFVYDGNGINLVHPAQPELVGQNLIDLRDYNGEFVIRPLLQIAREGEGYHRYLWKKPSLDLIEEKLGYVAGIPEWGWMFGTGLYIDDISREVNKLRDQVSRNIRENHFTVSIIVLGTLLIIVLLGLAINLHESRLADERLRALAHRSVLFNLQERRRFSRELHDGINQLMVSVLYRMELAQRRLAQGDQRALEDLQKGREVLNDAIQEVRRISHDLRPSILDDLGFESALGNLLEQFSERTGIRLRTEVSLEAVQLPEAIEITLYRMIQEALTNVERHADASELVLRVDAQRDAVRMDLRDNGQGFDPQGERHRFGIGLRNMHERVELLGGNFRLDTAPGEGLRIRVSLPIKTCRE